MNDCKQSLAYFFISIQAKIGNFREIRLYSPDWQNLLLLRCLFQTSCDMSAYDQCKDVRLRDSVLHRTELYLAGNGAARHTATQHRMTRSCCRLINKLYCATQTCRFSSRRQAVIWPLFRLIKLKFNIA